MFKPSKKMMIINSKCPSHRVLAHPCRHKNHKAKKLESCFLFLCVALVMLYKYSYWIFIIIVTFENITTALLGIQKRFMEYHLVK